MAGRLDACADDVSGIPSDYRSVHILEKDTRKIPFLCHRPYLGLWRMMIEVCPRPWILVALAYRAEECAKMCDDFGDCLGRFKVEVRIVFTTADRAERGTGRLGRPDERDQSSGEGALQGALRVTGQT